MAYSQLITLATVAVSLLVCALAVAAVGVGVALLREMKGRPLPVVDAPRLRLERSHG